MQPFSAPRLARNQPPSSHPPIRSPPKSPLLWLSQPLQSSEELLQPLKSPLPPILRESAKPPLSELSNNFKLSVTQEEPISLNTSYSHLELEDRECMRQRSEPLESVSTHLDQWPPTLMSEQPPGTHLLRLSPMVQSLSSHLQTAPSALLPADPETIQPPSSARSLLISTCPS